MIEPPRHHPSSATIACHASGGLPDPAALPVALHLRVCAHCRRRVAQVEAAAGAPFAALRPAGMDAGALRRKS